MNDLTIRQREMIEDVERLDFDMEFRLSDVWKELGFNTKGNAVRTLKSLSGEVEYQEVLLIIDDKQTGSGGHNKKDYTMKLKPYMHFIAAIHTSAGKAFRKELVDVYTKVLELKAQGAKVALVDEVHSDPINQALMESIAASQRAITLISEKQDRSNKVLIKEITRLEGKNRRLKGEVKYTKDSLTLIQNKLAGKGTKQDSDIYWWNK